MHASSLAKIFVAILAAVSPAAAELSVTAPIDGTTCTGGQPCNVAWRDDGRGVTLAQQGNCTVGLYTGNAQQQTFLQPIAFPEAVNVATTAAIQFVVDPTVGENGGGYFIRFSSTSLQNPNSTGNPYLSFSAKFILTGMTGTFNASVQSQLAGVTSAGGATATGNTATGGSATRTSTGRTSTAPTSSVRPNSNNTGAGSPRAIIGVSSGSTGMVVAAGAVLAGFAALL